MFEEVEEYEPDGVFGEEPEEEQVVGEEADGLERGNHMAMKATGKA